MSESYDALLVMSFGGPEGPDDVIPFLERVTRGRNVPRERLEEVAEHYLHFGGVSPINAQNRALIAALEGELASHGLALPIYFGNRNWHPLVEDTVARMADDGVERALVFVTSAWSSYSGCRQYREDLARARAAVGERAPVLEKLRQFFNHPGFIEAHADGVRAALEQLPAARRDAAELVFTAHSVPLSMARSSRYVAQLEESSRLVAEAVAHPRWSLVYQSRSGPPHLPWLEPDILDHLEALAARGVQEVVVSPVGFVSDHMEVLYDLDTEAQERACELGLELVRAATPGTHPAFVAMIRELVQERLLPTTPRRALGKLGAPADVCGAECCRPLPQERRAP